ncbi:MAG: hypothetical protein LBM41_03795 [Ruminococcus sp.]|nr:hypothetical protein [Ruminococcus sp.]
MTMITCPFCESTSCKEISSENNKYDCPSCGKYQLDIRADDVLNAFDYTINKLRDFAGYLYETNHNSRSTKFIKLKKDNSQQYSFEDEVYNSGLVPKTTLQKIDKFITNIYKLGNLSVQKFTFWYGLGLCHSEFAQTISHHNYRGEIAYAKDIYELNSIIKLAQDAGLINSDSKMWTTDCNFLLSFKGLQRAESLISTNTESNQIFIACKFSNPDTGVFREYFVNSVKDAAEKASDGKYHAIIVSDIEYNDGISDRLKAEIKRSKAVIVDYTYESQNVYFEAGYADALGLPIIRCCDENWANEYEGGLEKAVHFDERHNNLILWKSYKELQQRIEDRIRNILM